MRKNQKRKIDRSIWKKNLYPLPRSFRGPLRIAPKKRDSLDEHLSAKTERSSSHTTPVKHKKQDSKKSRVQMKTSRSAQDVPVKKSENRGLQDKELEDRRWKNKGTSMEELERCFHQRELNALLICDPVLKILKPKLIGSLQGPVTAPIETAIQLEAIRRVMKLLQEAGFIVGSSTRRNCWNVITIK